MTDLRDVRCGDIVYRVRNTDRNISQVYFIEAVDELAKTLSAKSYPTRMDIAFQLALGATIDNLYHHYTMSKETADNLVNAVMSDMPTH